MFRYHYHRFVGATLLLGSLIACGILASSTVASELTVRVDTMKSFSNNTAGELRVYVTNPLDSIAGFMLPLQLNRPDLIRFDSAVDVNGSITSQFALMQIRSLSGTWNDVEITGIGSISPFPPPGVIGFGPSSTERLLLRVPFHTLTIADTATDRTVGISIPRNPQLFEFVRTDGSDIGAPFPPHPNDTVYDSVVSLINGTVTISNPCNLTYSDIDIDLNGIPLTIADYVYLLRYIDGDTSIVVDPYIADINGDCRIDFGDAFKLDSIFKYGYQCDFVPCPLPCRCDHLPVRYCCYQMRGNLTNDPDNVVDLADLSALVSYLTGGAAVVKCPEAANVNGQGIIDLGDLSYLVAYLIGGGPKPPNCP